MYYEYQCLVSMTTPRDVRLHGATITPSFTEFDMISEGFGCMLLTSISPQVEIFYKNLRIY